MKYKNHDQENRSAEDYEHPSLNPKEFGYNAVTNIPDDFKYTPTKYVCPKCNSSKCSPYAYTSELNQLIESNAKAQLVALNNLNKMEAVN